MAHPYHHSLSSVRKWGGTVDDYLALHSWFDASKAITADFRHRALRHHAEGIFLAENIFGPTITLSSGRIIPTRGVGEQHVIEDLGFIPSFADWVKCIRPEPWMGRAARNGSSLRSSRRVPRPEPRKEPDLYGTYLRLDITVHDGWRAVVRAAARKLTQRVLRDPRHRAARKRFYRQMLDGHRQAQDLVLTWRL